MKSTTEERVEELVHKALKGEGDMDIQREFLELKGDCKVEKQRMENMGRDITELKQSIQTLFNKVGEMEKNWRVLLVLVGVIQTIAIPLIIKAITN